MDNAFTLPPMPEEEEKQLEWAEGLLERAKELVITRNHEKGLSICQKLVPILYKKKERKLYVDGLRWWSESLYWLRYYKKAVEKAMLILKIKDKCIVNFYKYEISAHFLIGLCLSELGDYGKAIRYQRKAIDIAEKFDDGSNAHSVVLARTYENLAIFFEKSNNVNKAIKLHQRILQRRLKSLGNNHFDLSNSYINLGTCCFRKKEYRDALHYYQKALEIQKSFGQRYKNFFAETYTNIGMCFSELKDYKEAIKYFEKSLEVFLSIITGKHDRLTQLYFGIAGVYKKMKSYNEAFVYVQKSLQSSVFKHDNSNFHYIQNIKKKPVNEVVLEIFKLKYSLLFNVFRENNNLIFLKSALLTTQITSLLVERLRKALYSGLNRFSLSEGAFEALSQGIQIALTAAQTAQQQPQAWLSATKEIAQINHDSYPESEFPYCWTAQDCLNTAFQFCEQSRAMVLFSQLQEKEARGQSPLPKATLEQLQDLEAELNYLNKKIRAVEANNDIDEEEKEKQVTALESQKFDYKEKYDELLKTIEQDYPEYHRLKYNTQVTTVAEVQAHLAAHAPQTAVIEYFVGEKYLYIFGITKDHYQVKEIELPTDFEELIKNFTDNLTGHVNRPNYINWAHQLYQWLLAPILEQTEWMDANITALKIIPDGILNYIPFDGLLYQAVGERTPYPQLPYLLNKYAITRHFSATLWLWQAQRKQKVVLPNSFLGVAPVYKPIQQEDGYDEQTDRFVTKTVTAEVAGVTRYLAGEACIALLESEIEITQIQQQFVEAGYTADVLLHENATIPQFKEKAAQYRFIHIAAHHVYDEQHPQLSGIIFSPSKPTSSTTMTDVDEVLLDAQERSSQRNHGAVFFISDAYNIGINADLVLLSCCETGKGEMAKGEGVLAIHRGFLYAGANNVIHTLFKIRDDSSSELMQAFFKGVLREQLPYVEALRRAKQGLIGAGDSPKHWAGYVLVGK